MSGAAANNLPIGLDDPDSIAAYLQLQRKAALVQALQQDSLTAPTVQQPQGGGKYYQAARVGPLNALSKLAEALIAKKGYGDVDKGEAAQRQAELRAFGGGGSETPPPPAPGAGASDVGMPTSAQPFQGAPQQRTSPYNPGGLPPSAALALAHSDPKAYVDYLKGTPEWQNMLLASNGDVGAARAAMLAKAEHDRSIELRTGNTNYDPLTHKSVLAPNPAEGVTFQGDPLSPQGVTAQPIANSEAIAAQRKAALTAAEQANTPHAVTAPGGTQTFAAPALKTPLPAPGAPQAPNSPPASSVAPPPKSYFPTTSTANAQTTAGKESQETGAKAGQEYRSNLAADAAGALEVKRSLAEMANLAASQAPSASNTLRMRIGQFAIASGVDPQKVASWTGIDPGVLEAAKKQTSGLAVASIHQLTNRGTNFDLETFMENNPNLLQTPGGFSRVVQYMNGKSDSIIAKQHDFEQFIKQKGPDGEPLSEDDWHGAHTAHWNQKQLDDIKAGKYNSVAPPEKSTMINGVRYVKQGGVWVQQ